MDPNTYQYAQTHVVYRIVPEPGYLIVGGEDQQNFLQRQTTNDLRLVLQDRAVLTVLTSATARILDVITVFPAQVAGASALALLTQPGRQVATERFLRSRVFFMDRVEIQNLSPQYVQVELIGPETGEMLGSLDLPAPSAPDGWGTGTFQGEPAQVLGRGVTLGLGMRLVVPSALSQSLEGSLQQAGLQPCDEETYQVLRVEAGLPGVEAELNEAYSPLEVGLASLVSNSKGCYTGQEVIARQMNYDKVTRSLVGLRLEAPVDAGSSLTADGKPVGEVTSPVVSPNLGPIALGIVRRPAHEAGTVLNLGSSTGAEKAVVTPLPFISS